MKKKSNGRELKLLLLRQAVFSDSYQERLRALTTLSRCEEQEGWLLETLLVYINPLF